eukprot:6183102-Amphidinium_carterae.1
MFSSATPECFRRGESRPHTAEGPKRDGSQLSQLTHQGRLSEHYNILRELIMPQKERSRDIIASMQWTKLLSVGLHDFEDRTTVPT